MGRKIRASMRAVMAPKIYGSIIDGLEFAITGCKEIKNAPIIL